MYSIYVRMYMCMYSRSVRTHVCTYVCTVCTYVCLYVCTYVCIYMTLCTHVRMYVYECTYVCTYTCTYVHMYACTCTVKQNNIPQVTVSPTTEVVRLSSVRLVGTIAATVPQHMPVYDQTRQNVGYLSCRALLHRGTSE